MDGEKIHHVSTGSQGYPKAEIFPNSCVLKSVSNQSCFFVIVKTTLKFDVPLMSAFWHKKFRRHF
jgi:hypothetical protein